MLRVILSINLMLFVNLVFAEPIENVEKFQSSIGKCIVGKKPGLCLNTLLPKHVPPGNESMAKQLPQVANILVKWLADRSVYAIHPIKSEKVGDLVDNRFYAIEASSTGFMVMQVKYLKILGKSYLFEFNLSSTEEDIDALLSGNL